jgi:hypothetical protein
MVPEWIEHHMVRTAVAQAAAKKPFARVGEVRLGLLCEGRCVQTLHVGPFDAEADVLAQMHDVFIPARGLRMVGKHHEIYLNDFRRVAPAKLRTILRQPVAS